MRNEVPAENIEVSEAQKPVDAVVLEVANETHRNSAMTANNVRSKAVGGAEETLETLFTQNVAFKQAKDTQVAAGSDITLKLDGRKFTVADYATVRTQAAKLNQRSAMLHLVDLTTEAEQKIRAMNLKNVTAHSMQHSHDAFVAKDETPAAPVTTEKEAMLAA